MRRRDFLKGSALGAVVPAGLLPNEFKQGVVAEVKRGGRYILMYSRGSVSRIGLQKILGFMKREWGIEITAVEYAPMYFHDNSGGLRQEQPQMLYEVGKP